MISLFRRLYDWTLEQAAKPYAMWMLALIAFAEASFFPIPQDVLFFPLILAARHKWLQVVTVALVASVVGGICGYGIGYFLYESVGEPLLSFYHKDEAYQAFQAQYQANGFWIVLAGAFTPIPYKVITIASGAAKMNLALFIGTSLIGRGLRFLILGYLLYRFGPQIKRFIDRWFGPLSILGVLLVIGGFVALRAL